MNPIYKQIATRIIGDAVRTTLKVVGTWLAAKGVGALTPDTQTNLVDIITGGLLVAGGFVWSFMRSYFKDKTINSLANQVIENGGVPVTPKGDEIKAVVPTTILALCLGLSLLMGCVTAPKLNPKDVTRISETVTSLVLRFCHDDQDRKAASNDLYAMVVGIRSMTGAAKPSSDAIELTILAFAGGDDRWRSVCSFISLFGDNLDAVAEGVEAAAATIRDK